MSQSALGSHLLIAAAGGRVRAFDRRTGERVWEVLIVDSQHPVVGNVHFGVELAIHDRIVLASAYASTHLYCIDYPSGSVLGRVDVGRVGRKSVLVDGDQIFVGLSRLVRCYDLHGQLLWESGSNDEALAGVVALGFPGNVRQADQGN